MWYLSGNDYVVSIMGLKFWCRHSCEGEQDKIGSTYIRPVQCDIMKIMYVPSFVPAFPFASVKSHHTLSWWQTLVMVTGIHKFQALRCQKLHPWLPSYIKVRPQVFISMTNSAHSVHLVKTPSAKCMYSVFIFMTEM